MKYNVEFTEAVRAGFARNPKQLPSRFFYDAIGSDLFNQITKLPEYYLTFCEKEILTKHNIVHKFTEGKKDGLNVIELGPGDGSKAAILLRYCNELEVPVRYIPVDISAAAIAECEHYVKLAFPSVLIASFEGDYFEGLRYATRYSDRRSLVLFLGSSLGNFTNGDAQAFINAISSEMRSGDGLLLGLDLRKNPSVIIPAYSDAQAVTAQFNLNLLSRMNKELGANFELNKFIHHASYNPVTGAMESYLLSTVQQSVRIDALKASVEFEAWEPIHTEYSCKYGIPEIERMGKAAGLHLSTHFIDRKSYFDDSLWTKP
ncbi:MAG: L-histidine N(alpha)-methyltransferase [Candidatus Doudnabacteria bacterium]